MLREKQVSKGRRSPRPWAYRGLNPRHFIRTQKSPQKPQKVGTGSDILGGYFNSNPGGTRQLRLARARGFPFSPDVNRDQSAR